MSLAKYPSRVTAVMAVADPRLLNIGRMTVNQFWQQSYQHKHMLIVNSSGTPLMTQSHPLITEFAVNPVEYPTIGAMRNYGMQQVEDGWIMPWDYDDHSHAHRISLQMAHRQEDCCVVLAAQMRVDVGYEVRQHTRAPVVCVMTDPDGIPSTILFPKGHVYDDTLVTGEQKALLNQFGGQKVVLNNLGWFPGPAMHIAFWHGNNVLPFSQFFGPYADPKYAGLRAPELNDEMFDYLKWALALYGMSATVVKPEEASESTPLSA